MQNLSYSKLAALLLVASSQFIYVVLAVSAPTTTGAPATEMPTVTTPAATSKAPEPKGLTAEFLHKYLAAEIAAQRGEIDFAAGVFFQLAQTTQDARLAERAARAALFGKNQQLAAEATALWLKLDPTSAEAQQTAAQMFIVSGNLVDAKPQLQKLLAKEETRANGFLYLNGLLAKQQDKKAVLKLVEELAQPYPTLAEAQFTLANSAWIAGDDTKALNALTKADQLKSGWEVAALLRGQVLSTQSLDTTINFYKKFLDQYPEANEVRLSLVRALIAQKRNAEAKVEIKKLSTSAKADGDSLALLGLLSYQAGELDDASGYFQDTLKLPRRDNEQTYIYLGQIASKQKKYAEAEKWFNQVKPGDLYLDAQINHAEMLVQSKNVDAAIDMLDNVQNLDEQQQAEVLRVQASLLSQVKRDQEAYDLLEKAVKNLPVTHGIIYDYAMMAEKIKKYDVSERELRRVMVIKPDFAQAYNALGYSLADRNIRLQEAKALIEKALSYSPNDHFTLDSLGWVEYRLGNLAVAAEHLSRAFNVSNDPEIAAHLGEVLWQQGKKDEAKKLWNEAKKASPDNQPLLDTIKKFNS